MSSVARRLREARENAGFNHVDAARLSGIPKFVIQLFESGAAQPMTQSLIDVYRVSALRHGLLYGLPSRHCTHGPGRVRGAPWAKSNRKPKLYRISITFRSDTKDRKAK